MQLKRNIGLAEVTAGQHSSVFCATQSGSFVVLCVFCIHVRLQPFRQQDATNSVFFF